MVMATVMGRVSEGEDYDEGEVSDDNSFGDLPRLCLRHPHSHPRPPLVLVLFDVLFDDAVAITQWSQSLRCRCCCCDHSAGRAFHTL